MNRKIENPFLYVEVSDRGAELMRIMRKDTGAEILWNGDPAFWSYRSRFFFRMWEVPGRKNEDQRKGISDPPAWICQRKKNSPVWKKVLKKLRYRLMSDEETRKYYPFDFVLWITYELREKRFSSAGKWKPIRGSHEFYDWRTSGLPF